MNRKLVLYVLTIVIFGSLLWFVFKQGARLNVIPFAQTILGETQESAKLKNPKSTSQTGELVEKILEVELAPG